MEREYIIYVHVNKINGKRYVGQTCQEPNRRFGSNGIGYRECCYFYNAIKKYGWDNFDHQILYTGLSKKEADAKEIELIKQWNLTDPEFGYNLREGGDGFDSATSLTLWNNLEYKANIARKNKERWEDPEYKTLNSARMREAWKDPSKRQKRSEAAVDRWSNQEFHDRVTNAVRHACARKIICLETSEVFDCIKDAAEKLGISDKNAQRAIKKGGRWGGFHWSYYDDNVSVSA